MIHRLFTELMTDSQHTKSLWMAQGATIMDSGLTQGIIVKLYAPYLVKKVNG
jgi:hypothetical protein